MFAILHILKYCCVKDWEPSIWAFYTFYIAIFENINIMQSLCIVYVFKVDLCSRHLYRVYTYIITYQYSSSRWERRDYIAQTKYLRVWPLPLIREHQRTPPTDVISITGQACCQLSPLTTLYSRSLLLWRNVLLSLTLVALWVGCYFIKLRVLRPLVIIWRIIWCSLVANPCL